MDLITLALAKNYVDGQVEKIKMDSVTPEYYGAVGDGVTDDTLSITQALQGNKKVFFNGNSTYLISSTIVIPENVYVDFGGATIVPNGNFDVIRMMPGAYIENLIVKCTDVEEWNSSVIVFYGGDGFSASNPTRLNNIKLYNDTAFNNGFSSGNGFYLYLDENGRYIEGISVTQAATCGFGKGIYMHDKTGEGEYTGNRGFIGANNFLGYWSYRDTIGIYIDVKSTHGLATNNSFTDLNIQSDYYSSSQYGIYCSGDSNYFSGCLYDYAILNYHPATGIYFSLGSTKNRVEVSSGSLHPGYCIDLGSYNKVVVQHQNDIIALPINTTNGVTGNQDDIFAFLDKRANCTIESLDIEPKSGDISSIFDPSPSNILYYKENTSTGKCRAIITLNLNKVLRKMTHLILQFPHRYSPRSVKITIFNAETAKVVYDTDINSLTSIVVSPGHFGEQIAKITNISKIVIELGGSYEWEGMKQNGWGLSRIMAVDGYNIGNTWLSRGGGEIYGNIRFAQDSAPILTSEDGKTYKLIVSSEGQLSTAEVVIEEEETPEAAVLVPTMASGATWYNSDLAKMEQNAITAISFDSDYEPTGNEDANWFCDEDDIGNIVAYRNGTEVTIKSTTGSAGVKLNTNSTYMFANDGTNANFASLTNITGTYTLTADNNTDCTAILKGNTLITKPITIPIGVYVINGAFNGCTALATPPELPEGIIAMNNAFANCSALQYLPTIPSTVTKMSYAFHVCRSVTNASITIPEKVKEMNATFRNCFNFNGTIEVNASSPTSYGAFLENACRDSGSIVLTGTCPLLAELAATNTHGKVTIE